MKAANVTERDILAKLREANVTSFSQIRAVLFETTGDISVLHASVDTPSLDERLLEGVKR